MCYTGKNLGENLLLVNWYNDKLLLEQIKFGCPFFDALVVAWLATTSVKLFEEKRVKDMNLLHKLWVFCTQIVEPQSSSIQLATRREARLRAFEHT